MTQGDDRHDGSAEGHTEGPSPQQRQAQMRTDAQVQVTGATVLFSFLLSFPFSAAFGRLSDFEQVLYYVGLGAAASTLALVLAPTVYGRLLIDHDPEAARDWSARTLAAGMAAFGLTVVAVVVLVTNMYMGTVGVVLFGGAAAVVFAALWLAIPLVSARR